MKLFTIRFRSILIFLFFFVLNIHFTLSQTPAWGSVSPGTNGVIYSMIEYKGNLVVAGRFTTPGRNIAMYDGSGWSALGTGTNDTILGLEVYENKLVAVGSFDSAGTIACNNIAQWDGTVWSTLGLGTNNTINSVDSAGNFLVIGGQFTNAGGISCSHIAKWQSGSWSALGNGTNGNVYALKQFGNKLIIGGAFTSADTVSAKRIVQYDLTSNSFSALGSGIDSNNVLSLGIFQDNLYVGGDFKTIGGLTYNRIARWTGTNWDTVRTGTNGPVKSIYPFQGLLFIGGTFDTAGGVRANNISMFTGGTFFSLGGGMTGTAPSVNALTGWRLILFAGGLFSSPGSNIARYGALPVAPELLLPADGAQGISVTPTFTWLSIGYMYSFRIQIARDANFTNIVSGDSNLTAATYTVPGAQPLANDLVHFWRVRALNGYGNGPFSLVRFFVTGFLGVINQNEIPERFNLYQNYPNPFNPVTKIKFDLPAIDRDAVLKLNIYSITGEKVKEVLNTAYSAGKWEMDFDASNLASGIYFYKIEAGPYVQTNKMILVK